MQLIENDPQNTGKLAEISNTFTNNIGKIRQIREIFILIFADVIALIFIIHCTNDYFVLIYYMLNFFLLLFYFILLSGVYY